MNTNFEVYIVLLNFRRWKGGVRRKSWALVISIDHWLVSSLVYIIKEIVGEICRGKYARERRIIVSHSREYVRVNARKVHVFQVSQK